MMPGATEGARRVCPPCSHPLSPFSLSPSPCVKKRLVGKGEKGGEGIAGLCAGRRTVCRRHRRWPRATDMAPSTRAMTDDEACEAAAAEDFPRKAAQKQSASSSAPSTDREGDAAEDDAMARHAARRARMLGERGRHGEAYAALEHAIEALRLRRRRRGRGLSGVAAARLLGCLGTHATSAGRPDDATSSFEAAILAVPEDPPSAIDGPLAPTECAPAAALLAALLRDFGVSLRASGCHPARAAWVHLRAHRLAPDDGGMRTELACSLNDLGTHIKHRPHDQTPLEEALASAVGISSRPPAPSAPSPNGAPSGDCAAALGAARFERLYAAAASADPSFAPAHYNLGVAMAERGDADGAIAAYERAIALTPEG